MNPFCSLAKKAIETYIEKGEVLAVPKDLPAEFNKRAGVFVTLLKKGLLRGCIGTCLPTKANIAEEIIANAIAAATKDWRFPPLCQEELPALSYEVSILEPPRLIRSLTELDPKKFGIIIRGQSSGKSALLLPNLDGINTPQKQLSICLQKAGIDPSQEKITIYKFRTKQYTT